MFHCHNLIHEDQDMMAAFNVTALSNLGYNNTKFIDPMEEQWRAKPYQAADMQARAGPFTDEAITNTVQSMASMQPYKRIEGATKKRHASFSNEMTGPVPRYRRFQV